MKKTAVLLIAAALLIFSAVPITAEDAPTGSVSGKDMFIDRIIGEAESLYNKANGRRQRAQYAGDIYVCKNFTTYVFRVSRDDFRMAEFPDTQLVIPDNQTKNDCRPYAYGVEWKDISAADGNPFYAAASFRYDSSLTREENRQKAREFMMQVRRGDYFQMSANYYYGVGAHSLIFIADYDSETDSVRWTDSNMKGDKVNGIRYGYVQFDAVKDINWFVDAFCQKTRGATLYRLRDDIVYIGAETGE